MDRIAHAAAATVLARALGLVASWALARLIRNMLFGVTFSDPATFAAAIAMLTTVAVLAGYLPARRAARLNPMEVMRAG